MIGFVMVGTNNLDKATKFYDTLLNTIELHRVVTNEKYAGGSFSWSVSHGTNTGNIGVTTLLYLAIIAGLN